MSEDWTRDQCAEHWGISPSTWSGYVVRSHAPQPYTHIGRTPLWDADTVREYPRPGQGARTDLVMPEKMPVIHQTSVGSRDNAPSLQLPPSPRRWRVEVTERARLGDTRLAVVTPSGQEVANVVWADRLTEGDEELDEAVAWIVSAARLVWQAAPRLLAGAKPAVLWGDVADAWKFAGQRAYFAWAQDVIELGAATEANL